MQPRKTLAAYKEVVEDVRIAMQLMANSGAEDGTSVEGHVRDLKKGLQGAEKLSEKDRTTLVKHIGAAEVNYKTEGSLSIAQMPGVDGLMTKIEIGKLSQPGRKLAAARNGGLGKRGGMTPGSKLEQQGPSPEQTQAPGQH